MLKEFLQIDVKNRMLELHLNIYVCHLLSFFIHVSDAVSAPQPATGGVARSDQVSKPLQILRVYSDN